MRTLTIDTAAAPFHLEHARRLAAREPAARPRPAAPDDLARRYAPGVCAAAAATWRDRMVNEHRSSAVFAALLPQLIEASATLDAQTCVLEAAADEIYHATLCAEVVRAFGGADTAQAEPVLPRVAEHPGLDPLERVARNVMFVGCLSETVAVALISEEHELAREPFVRAILARILSDEVAHARLGWRFLAHVLPRLGPDAPARFAAYLRTAFAYLETRELALLPLAPPCEGELRAQREAVGLCHGADARALFYQTLADVIVPRLSQLGIDARAAWRDRGAAGSLPAPRAAPSPAATHEPPSRAAARSAIAATAPSDPPPPPSSSPCCPPSTTSAASSAPPRP